jgi:hypothetical protein
VGAWGYAALDNDPALDVLQRWREWVEDPAGIGYDGAIEQYFTYWGDALKYGDPITNMELIALLAIHLNNGLKVPKRLLTAAAAAINRELVEEELQSWEEPEKRKEALLQLLSAIGGKIKPPKPPKVFGHPAIHFKNTPQARAELLQLAKIAKEKGGLSIMYDDSVAVPPFLQTLHRLMMHRVWEADFNVLAQATRERQMMLAWYLGIASCVSLEELPQMLDRAKGPW